MMEVVEREREREGRWGDRTGSSRRDSASDLPRAPDPFLIGPLPSAHNQSDPHRKSKSLSIQLARFSSWLGIAACALGEYTDTDTA